MLSAAGSLHWLRDTIAPGEPFDALVAEAERWPPGAEGLTFLPYLQRGADAARRPGRARRVRGADAAARSRRARPRGARGRGLRRCATRSSCCGSSASSPRSGGSPAAAPAASSGFGSSLRCSTFRSSGRPSRREPPTARRSSAGSPPASSPTSTRPSRRCVRVADDDRARARLARHATRTDTSASGLSTRPYDHWRNHDLTRRKGRVVTGASRGIGAAVARALDARAYRLGLASRSGDDLGLDGRSRSPATCASRTAARGARRPRRSSASAASTSSSRTPASAPTARSSSCRPSSSRR